MLTVYTGSELAAYGFGADHPFNNARHDAFLNRMKTSPLYSSLDHASPVLADRETIERFHTPEYVSLVQECSLRGSGYLDQGDTPAFRGVYEAAAYVVGSVVDATRKIVEGKIKSAFIPIAGLHHARRNSASGFCVFNDCGVAIEILLQDYDLKRVAYVDIDAHHGDGVYYDFETVPQLIFADLHENGRYLFPGSGFSHETGKGAARGKKMNIEMEPGSGDDEFFREWEKVETFLRSHSPEFIIFQCGADSLAGDPLTHLQYSEKAHAHAAERLVALAREFAGGRLIALGGGGYNLASIARGWVAVVEQMAV